MRNLVLALGAFFIWLNNVSANEGGKPELFVGGHTFQNKHEHELIIDVHFTTPFFTKKLEKHRSFATGLWVYGRGIVLPIEKKWWTAYAGPSFEYRSPTFILKTGIGIGGVGDRHTLQKWRAATYAHLIFDKDFATKKGELSFFFHPEIGHHSWWCTGFMNYQVFPNVGFGAYGQKNGSTFLGPRAQFFKKIERPHKHMSSVEWTGWITGCFVTELKEPENKRHNTGGIMIGIELGFGFR